MPVDRPTLIAVINNKQKDNIANITAMAMMINSVLTSLFMLHSPLLCIYIEFFHVKLCYGILPRVNSCCSDEFVFNQIIFY